MNGGVSITTFMLAGCVFLNVVVQNSGLLFPELINDLVSAGFNSGRRINYDVLPEAVMRTMEIIRYHGYPGEKHRAITPDGYILEMHRITGGKLNTTAKEKREPIMVQHGIISSSATWLINGEKDSLGFVLADNGYDVWLTNLRGNTYCRNHVSLSPDDPEFWNFSLDDHALIDLPTMIDYILSKSGFDKLRYIGHSMGTTTAVMLLSGKPEYNSKIKLTILQAPVVFERYLKNPLRLLGLNIEEATKWYSILGTNELLSSSEFFSGLFQSVCSGYPGVVLCEAIISLVAGYNEELTDRERLPIVMSHLPAGTSWQVIQHFSQVFLSKKPVRYDFGPEGNMIKYNQMAPPVYNLTQASSPIAIFYGYMDLFTDGKDVETLKSKLPNVYTAERVPHDLWTHQDFQFAKNAGTIHYQRLLEVLKVFD